MTLSTHDICTHKINWKIFIEFCVFYWTCIHPWRSRSKMTSHYDWVRLQLVYKKSSGTFPHFFPTPQHAGVFEQAHTHTHTQAHTLCSHFCLLWEPHGNLSPVELLPHGNHTCWRSTQKEKKPCNIVSVIHETFSQLWYTKLFEALLKIDSVAARWLSDLLHVRVWITSCMSWGQWGLQPINTTWKYKTCHVHQNLS